MEMNNYCEFCPTSRRDESRNYELEAGSSLSSRRQARTVCGTLKIKHACRYARGYSL